MKKLFVLLLGITLCYGTFAQSRLDRIEDRVTLEIGQSPFFVSPLSHFYFGFSGIMQGDASVKEHTSFFKNPQLGFNIVELGVNAGRHIQFTLGADVNWTWYHLDKDHLWAPNSSNGTQVSVLPKELSLIKKVNTSIFTVPTFEFPLNVYFRAGRARVQLGASLELNMSGFTQFKGVDVTDQSINEMKNGLRYTKNISNNLLGYNAHVAFLFSNMGIYAKFRPRPVIAQNNGPQFNTWSLGLFWRFKH